jgi:pilus assembly protein CpaF
MPRLDHALVRRLQGQVADHMSAARQARAAGGRAPLPPADERQFAQSAAAGVVARYMQSLLNSGQELPEDAAYDEYLVNAVLAAMYGAGELQGYLDDPAVENININGCDEVWVTYADGRKQRKDPVAATDEDLVDIVQALGAYASHNARPFTPASPTLDVRLRDGSRLAAIMQASERPAVSIRRNRYPRMTLAQLVELDSLDEETAQFLRAAVQARCNIVVGGATDAGKTTVLRALIDAIDPAERLLVIELTFELGLRRQRDEDLAAGRAPRHEDVLELEELRPDAEGVGGLSMDMLVRRSRRHDSSRTLVGEVMGPEVGSMLSAMSQGNDGSLSTVHARSARNVFDRLATYAAQHENNLGFEVAHALIAQALDLVVFVKKNPLMGGRRCVTEILEVTGVTDGRVASSAIFPTSPVTGRAHRDRQVQIRRGKDLAGFGFDDSTGWGPLPATGWPR